MKKAILILLCIISNVCNAQTEIEPLSIVSIDHAVWNKITKKYVTWKTEKCEGVVFILKDRIKLKGCKEATYYYINSGQFHSNALNGVVIQCYNQMGNDCIVSLLFNTSVLNNRCLIVTFPEDFQNTYNLEQYKPK